MRRSVLILLLLLIAWITGSSYWYVCRVRCDCRQNRDNFSPAAPEAAVKSTSITEDSIKQALAVSLTEAENFLKNKGPILLYFEPGSTTTETDVIPEEFLIKLKFYLENKPEGKVYVTGHADISGNKSENEKLSQMRADFIKSFLVGSGIVADQVQTAFKADLQPVVSNSTPEGRSKNRRAEINI